MEGWSRLVMIPALHAGGRGFKSHSLHFVHAFTLMLYKTIMRFENKFYEDNRDHLK
jgi:hypothetical protein